MKSYFQAFVFVGLMAVSVAVPSNAWAQAGHSAAVPMQVWNRTSQGMSTNAALAFYRVQNVGRPAMQPPMWSPYSAPSPAMNYATGSYAAPTYYTATPVVSSPVTKPFSYVRPSPTAFDRYWPFLMEAQEDRETGLIIWTLP